MAEQMLFPETWEEFEKQYMMIDKEHIYSNGIKYIPCFRVRQWMEHIESKKKHEVNKMKEIAKLFGKQLGEEFWILGFSSVYRVKFCESGILYLDTDDPNKWVWRLGDVRPILTGTAEILTDDDWRVKQTLKDLGIKR